MITTDNWFILSSTRNLLLQSGASSHPYLLFNLTQIFH